MVNYIFECVVYSILLLLQIDSWVFSDLVLMFGDLSGRTMFEYGFWCYSVNSMLLARWMLKGNPDLSRVFTCPKTSISTRLITFAKSPRVR